MKKMYKQPIVEQEQLMPSSIVLAGSGETGIPTSNEPGQGIEGD